LIVALALRVPVLEWGLPPAIPAVVASDLRCSYALDEDDILTGVSFTNPARLDFDPRLYHWGTLHLHLTNLLLDGAEAFGYFKQPWRGSYYNMIPGEFERVYRLGRWLSLMFGLLCIAAVYLLGFECNGRPTAFWASAITAASPAHLLGSVQIRVDLTMLTLVTVAAWLGLRTLKTDITRVLFGFGLACGLAISAKYPALLLAVPMMLVVLHSRRYALRSLLRIAAGFAAGVLAGQPYLVSRWPEMVRQVNEASAVGEPVPPRFAVSTMELAAKHARNILRFAFGPAAALLSIAGLWMFMRRRLKASALVLAAFAGSVLALIPLKWPLLRYDLLLLPWLALAAAVALERMPRRWRWPVGVTALIFPLGGSLAQMHYMLLPHPANNALDEIFRVVPRGMAIARLMVELPPLDPKVYPMELNSFLDDLTVKPPEWVLTADLPDVEYTPANRALLAARYEEVALFRSERILSWATLGESGAPHDWKYTHPAMALYRRTR
jgi:4-amino-4-deoxy-L-arabinose transferase-like glycosyltransferase